MCVSGPPAVVEHLDVAHGRPSGVLAVVEAVVVVVVELVLDGREDGLDYGIIPAISGLSCGLDNTVPGAPGGEFRGGVLRSAVHVENSVRF